eukprot:4119182-Pleurochrysis_carterae.AAC.3
MLSRRERISPASLTRPMREVFVIVRPDPNHRDGLGNTPLRLLAIAAEQEQINAKKKAIDPVEPETQELNFGSKWPLADNNGESERDTEDESQFGKTCIDEQGEIVDADELAAARSQMAQALLRYARLPKTN